MDTSGYSPMMRHYLSVKEQYPDAILFYRLGDFYEMFFEDARTVSEALNLVLTKKAAGKEKVDMCGVPYHSSQTYIEKLIDLGFKIAICEQVSDPKAKGLVDREVVHVYTPGTYVKDSESKNNNYLSVLVLDSIYCLVLLCDIANGEILYETGENNPDWIKRFLLDYEVQEIVLSKKSSRKIKKELAKTFLVSETDLEMHQDLLATAMEFLNDYLEKTQFKKASHLLEPKKIENPGYLLIDYETKKHLELIHTLSRSKNAKSLWKTLDLCKGAMGSRKLKRWIEFPLRDPMEISARQQVISELLEDFILLDEIREVLSGIGDIERLISKISYQTISVPEIFKLIQSLKAVSLLKGLLNKVTATQEIKDMGDCSELLKKLDSMLEESETGWIRENVFPEYDQIVALCQDSDQAVNELEKRLLQEFQIPLKIIRQRTFGYLVEIRNSVLKDDNKLSLIEEKYNLRPKQSLTNATRFVYGPLQDLQEEIEAAHDKKEQFEKNLFEKILQELLNWIDPLRNLANGISEIDVLSAFAVKAQDGNWVRPEFNNEGRVIVRMGKHPVLTEINPSFTGNDWIMSSDTIVQCVTGPNMGGKSTFLRQNGLLAIMAQIGSYIPAESAELPIFDRIFTRIGASDDLLLGQSTFMTEMVETNRALRNSGPQSLILLDEIGRGTSTYDGMALSRAIVEYILESLKSKTLFSTHYHELTEIEDPSFENLNALVSEQNGNLTFLYKVVPGKASRSYGIQVAKLADLPQWVLSRSKNLLNDLESEKHEVSSLFVMEQNPYLDEIISRLRKLDIDEMTPRQALNYLSQVKEQIEKIDQQDGF